MGIGAAAFGLGLESSQVIAMRMMKIAAGGAAGEAESKRMVAEKIDAALEIQGLAMTGRLGWTAAGAASKALTHYRRKVRANRRRLAKS